MRQLHGFFEQARRGRLTAVRCRGCAGLAIPPQETCGGCGTREWEPVPLKGTGTITSFRIVESPPRGRPGAPYAVAEVRLAEGVSLLGHIVGIPPDALAVGQAVAFCPLVDGPQTTIAFGPV